MKLKILLHIFKLLISSSVIDGAFLKFPLIGGKANRMSPISTSRLTDPETIIETETVSSWTNQHNSLIPDLLSGKEDSGPEIEHANTQISKTNCLFPSIISSKPPEEATAKNKPPPLSSTIAMPPLNRFDFMSIRWFGDGDALDAQLRRTTIDLLNYMKNVADAGPISFPKPLNNRGKTIYFTELTDKNILAILGQLPTKNVPLDSVFETLGRIWSRVVSTTHRAIFEEVMKWAIHIVANNYPKHYYSLIDYIISNNIQYPSYQQALLKADLMSPDQVQFIVDHLLNDCLKENHFGDYIFYGKFNIHFLEIALNYQNFSKLSFIENIILPNTIHSTPTLELIYYSATLIEIISSEHADINPDRVVEISTVMKDHCIASKLSPMMLAEQYQIILNFRRDRLAGFDEAPKYVLLNALSESLEALLAANDVFPEIPHKREYALFVQGSFDDLLVLFIHNLKPVFTNDEFGYLVNLADNCSIEDPFGTFLTLLGSISLPIFTWYHHFDFFKERSLRVLMYTEVMLSIEDQNLTYDINSDYNPRSIFLRSLGKSKSLTWIVPFSLNEKNYEELSVEDLLVIPLLFIQRVFNRDYRDSPIIHKYLRLGKPNYNQFPKIINELLEDQCFGAMSQCPTVDFIIAKSYV